ncbi:hypothetical protein GU243_21785 [Pseudarthrobacter psychrotolerans]|uniref:HipA-like C-terminal domain-containing protein n=1 Tax=Pseudarthrobacter psychrotolerans TaxID=2697569 RepID=A0A6P1NQ56_9MICC|nr:HipA domain-containing protein [Pseudarthrobacter psychrotolerans]QHK21859.1 hypothetical protein GU243_21785 [Pseudarthrobacter psychrotolerans]
MPTWDLPDDFAVTASLGGIQSKVLLSRHGEGWTHDGGRLHQEDFTQALALASSAKYEGTTAPPSRLTTLVAAAAPHTRDDDAFRRDLLRAVTFNLVIGNGDAHSKDYSLLVRDGGEVLLAPLYDVAPTRLLYAPSVNAGHTLDGQARLNHLTLDHVVREGAAWGMDTDDARITGVPSP